MLPVGTNLPAEADPIQLRNALGVHPGRLAFPVQLVLTTLALDPVVVEICNVGGNMQTFWLGTAVQYASQSKIRSYNIYIYIYIYTYQVAN